VTIEKCPYLMPEIAKRHEVGLSLSMYSRRGKKSLPPKKNMKSFIILIAQGWGYLIKSLIPIHPLIEPLLMSGVMPTGTMVLLDFYHRLSEGSRQKRLPL